MQHCGVMFTLYKLVLLPVAGSHQRLFQNTIVIRHPPTTTIVRHGSRTVLLHQLPWQRLRHLPHSRRRHRQHVERLCHTSRSR